MNWSRIAFAAALAIFGSSLAFAGPPDGVVEGPHGNVPGFPANSCYVCHDIVPGATGRDAVMLPNETCLGCHTDGPTYGEDDPFIQDRPHATPVGNHASLVTGSLRFVYGEFGATWPFPEYEQQIHCTTCHDPHRTFDATDPTPSTQNIMYIRDHTDDWQVLPNFLVELMPTKHIKVIDNTTGTPVEIVKEVDQDIVYTGPGDFADGVGMLAAETNVCEVCHTLTNHHQNDNTAPGGQSHFDGEDCRSCHSHTNGFAPSGGQPLTGPHAVFGDPDCGACHDDPAFPGGPQNPGGLASVFCATCHDPVSVASLHSHSVTGSTRFEYTMECLSCHDQHGWELDNVAGTTNTKYVRARITEQIDVIDHTQGGLLVSKTIDNDIVFTGPGDFANGDYTGNICSTCHTLTSHHQNDGTAPGGQSHFDGQDCTTCHEHPVGFGTPGGLSGPPLTGPHATLAGFEPQDCFACHGQPAFPGGPQNPGGLASVFCATCHDPASVSSLHSHSVTGSTRFEYTMECLSCHDQHGWELDNVAGTTNTKYVRAHITEQIDVVDHTQGGLLVSKTIDNDIVFTGPGDFANGDYTGNICSTCHTLTSHHQNDGTAPGGQSHFDGQDCTGCHRHADGFGQDFDGTHPQAVTDCSNCHLNAEGDPDLVAVHGGDCAICHTNGPPGTFLGSAGTWGGECAECHNPAIVQTDYMQTPTKGHRCVVCHGVQRATTGSRSWHQSHAADANCVVCHGFIPNVGTAIGSGNRDICSVCHQSESADLQEIHEKHTKDAGLSCLECHGGVRPPIDAFYGSAVGGSARVCDLCHGNESGSPREIHEEHTSKYLDCGSCHLDANLQDDRVPMPPRDDARRAMTSRDGRQECFICHNDQNGGTTQIHRKHGEQWVWCFTCHAPDDDWPTGVAGPVTEPARSCGLCHNGHTYADETPFDIHRRHADRLKCYACHQTEPPLFGWPPEWLGGLASAIEDPPPAERAIAEMALRAHPNPFNPQTSIVYEIVNPGAVTLAVYDLRGRLVATLVHGEHKDVGSYTVPFEPRTAASGVYFVRLQANGKTRTLKIVSLK